MQNRRRFTTGLLLMVAGSLALLAVRFYPHEKLLLSRATYIPVSRWVSGDYLWQTEETLFCMLRDPKRRTMGVPSLVEPASNRVTPLANLRFVAERLPEVPPSVEFIKTGGGNYIEHPSYAISPDGASLVWEGGTSARPVWLVGKLPGREYLRLPGNPHYSVPVWSPDSRRWIEIRDGGEAWRVIVHSGVTAGIDKDLLLAGEFGDNIGDTVLGFRNNRTVVTANLQSEAVKNGTVNFFEFDIDGETAVPRHYAVKLTFEARVGDVALSPKGDRLAWLLYTEYHPFGLKTIPGWLSRLGYRSHSWAGLWVSGLDGREMREVGHVERLYEVSHSKSFYSLKSLRWLPEGKRLSFLYESALWTVPVD